MNFDEAIRIIYFELVILDAVLFYRQWKEFPHKKRGRK